MFWFQGSLRAKQYFSCVDLGNGKASLRVDPVGENAKNMVPLKMVTKAKLFGLGQ